MTRKGRKKRLQIDRCKFSIFHSRSPIVRKKASNRLILRVPGR